MSETKFTPGPWKVWGDWKITDCTKAENHIATFEHHDQRPRAGFANADLIAAAPDMYGQVELYLSLLDALIEDGMEGYIPRRESVANVLAKARGEKS